VYNMHPICVSKVQSSGNRTWKASGRGGVAGKVRENSHSQLMSFEAEPLPMAMSSGRCGCGCGWVDLKATFNCIRNCSS